MLQKKKEKHYKFHLELIFQSSIKLLSLYRRSISPGLHLSWSITLRFCLSNARFVLNTGVRLRRKAEEAESTVSVSEAEDLTPEKFKKQNRSFGSDCRSYIYCKSFPFFSFL